MIPKSFRLMGHDYTVIVVPESDWIDDETGGYCVHAQHKILLRGSMSDATQQQVFCHELVHEILHRMGEEELNQDEQFVDVFGSLLHQAWTTVK